MAKQHIGLLMLVLFITGAIDSIRNLPSTALFGTSLIFFSVAAAVFFLLPTGLVSAELCSSFTEENGGIYFWTKKAFGEKWGVFAIWLQWINTMVWYPTILSFIAGIFAYLFKPELASQKPYMVSMILLIFWSVTWINLGGLKLSVRMVGLCTLFGMAFPMALIILLALSWVLFGHPLAIPLSMHSLIPDFSRGDHWTALTAIMASFLGMELATVFVRDIHQAQKIFPKALLISLGLIVSTTILGSLAIAVVMPSEKISLVSGIMEAFQIFLASYHLQFALPVLGCMIVVGSIGLMNSWVISPAQGLLQAAENGYLPKIFSQKNKRGSPQNLLILQAVLVSCLSTIFWLIPSVNGAYWFLTDLSTQLYLLMYVLFFCAGIAIKKSNFCKKPGFEISSRPWVFYLVCVMGLIGTGVSLVVGFIPPATVDVGAPVHYIALFSGGICLMVLPVFALIAYRKKSFRT